MIEVAIGADEVGYGSIAGSMYVTCVAAPLDWRLEGLNDSKQLTRTARQALLPKLQPIRDNDKYTQVISTYIMTSGQIDKMGVRAALQHCYDRALQYCIHECLLNSLLIRRLFLDGDSTISSDYRNSVVSLGIAITQEPKADTLYPTVMAASVIAKEAHDKEMREFAVDWPNYGFDKHVGYGTPAHLAALRAYGPCPIHRMSYRPVAEAALDREMREFEDHDQTVSD